MDTLIAFKDCLPLQLKTLVSHKEVAFTHLYTQVKIEIKPRRLIFLPETKTRYKLWVFSIILNLISAKERRVASESRLQLCDHLHKYSYEEHWECAGSKNATWLVKVRLFVGGKAVFQVSGHSVVLQWNDLKLAAALICSEQQWATLWWAQILMLLKIRNIIFYHNKPHSALKRLHVASLNLWTNIYIIFNMEGDIYFRTAILNEEVVYFLFSPPLTRLFKSCAQTWNSKVCLIKS